MASLQTATILDSLLIYFGVGALTSLGGVLAYWWIRAVESRQSWWLYAGVKIWMFVFMLPIVNIEEVQRKWWIMAALGHLLLCLVSGWAHRKSGGSSRTLTDAFCVATASTVLGAFVSGLLSYLLFIIATVVGGNLTDQFFAQTQVPFYFGLFIYPPLVPIALLFWKSSRTRPGLDVPLPGADNQG